MQEAGGEKEWSVFSWRTSILLYVGVPDDQVLREIPIWPDSMALSHDSWNSAME
jgi:hypothetical protein